MKSRKKFLYLQVLTDLWKMSGLEKLELNFQFPEKMDKLEMNFQFEENNGLKMKFHYSEK